MSAGQQILDEIIRQGMVQVASPDPDENHVFAWKANTVEQLDAVVARIPEVEITTRVRNLFGEALEILGAPENASPTGLIEWATSLRADLAALRRDRERLDWLEDNLHHFGVDTDLRGPIHKWGFWLRKSKDGYDSARNRIDAARRAQPGSKEEGQTISP